LRPENRHQKGEERCAMIDIDITMPIQIANILIFIVIMNAVLYRPIRSILREREAKTAGLESDIENLKKNARLRIEEIDKKIRDARSKAKSELDGVRSGAQGAESARLSQIRKEAEGQKAEQMAQIRQQLEGARKELVGQVDSFAKEISGKILGRSLADV